MHAEAPTLTVSGRTIALPDIATDSLRSHKVATAVERLKADPLWEDNGLVFSSEVGTSLDLTNLRRTFARVCQGWARCLLPLPAALHRYQLAGR